MSSRQTPLTERMFVPLSAASEIAVDTLDCSVQESDPIVEECIRMGKARVKIQEDNGQWRYLKDAELENAKVDVQADFIGVGAEIVELRIVNGGTLLGRDAQYPIEGDTGKARCPGNARLYRPDFIEFLHAMDNKVTRPRGGSGSRKGIGGAKPKYDWQEIDLEFGLSLYIDGLPADYNINELVRRVWKRLEVKYGYTPDQMPQETSMKQRAAGWMRDLREEIEAVGN